MDREQKVEADAKEATAGVMRRRWLSSQMAVVVPVSPFDSTEVTLNWRTEAFSMPLFQTGTDQKAGTIRISGLLN